MVQKISYLPPEAAERAFVENSLLMQSTAQNNEGLTYGDTYNW